MDPHPPTPDEPVRPARPKPAEAVPADASLVPARSSRPLGQAWLGGVCAGLAEHLGWSVLVLRGLFVLLAGVRLIGVALYLALWLAMPRTVEGRTAPGLEAASRAGKRAARARSARSIDLPVASALALVGVGALWLVQQVGWGLSSEVLVPAGAAAIGLAAIWWQADHVSARMFGDTGGWRRWLAPLLAHWSTIVVIALGLAAIAVGIGLFAAAQTGLGETARLLLVLGLSVTGLLLAAAPWFLRARGALARAREDALLADARADVAAHLHDSVLQTLALIQRQASDPKAVATLARRQERELRQWLYGEVEAESTLRAELAGEAADVEDVHGVAIDVVTVGDCELTPDLAALVRATREAMVNAARHSGAGHLDVYAEVEPHAVTVFVRDRGRGFDINAVDEDRMGLRGSIIERVRRAGGRAIIRTAPGQGTEVELEMPR